MVKIVKNIDDIAERENKMNWNWYELPARYKYAEIFGVSYAVCGALYTIFTKQPIPPTAGLDLGMLAVTGCILGYAGGAMSELVNCLIIIKNSSELERKVDDEES